MLVGSQYLFPTRKFRSRDEEREGRGLREGDFSEPEGVSRGRLHGDAADIKERWLKCLQNLRYPSKRIICEYLARDGFARSREKMHSYGVPRLFPLDDNKRQKCPINRQASYYGILPFGRRVSTITPIIVLVLRYRGRLTG